MPSRKALYYAAHPPAAGTRGHAEVVSLLISKGADVHLKTQDGMTPLQAAMKGGHTKLAELLRQHGAAE